MFTASSYYPPSSSAAAGASRTASYSSNARYSQLLLDSRFLPSLFPCAKLNVWLSSNPTSVNYPIITTNYNSSYATTVVATAGVSQPQQQQQQQQAPATTDWNCPFCRALNISSDRNCRCVPLRSFLPHVEWLWQRVYHVTACHTSGRCVERLCRFVRCVVVLCSVSLGAITVVGATAHIVCCCRRPLLHRSCTGRVGAPPAARKRSGPVSAQAGPR